MGFLKKRLFNNQGFALFRVILVMAILVVLTSIVLPAYTIRAREAKVADQDTCQMLYETAQLASTHLIYDNQTDAKADISALLPNGWPTPQAGGTDFVIHITNGAVTSVTVDDGSSIQYPK